MLKMLKKIMDYKADDLETVIKEENRVNLKGILKL